MEGDLQMGYAELLLIGLGLSMDAFAAAVCKGLEMRSINKTNIVLIAVFFGGFQALMPLIGWLAGIQFEEYINSIERWIAFILLLIIGIKMIVEAYKNDDICHIQDKLDIKEIIMLAVATSIDALAVGITFAFLEVNILTAVSIIGLITFLLSISGIVIGIRFGAKYKNKAEFFGGVILIMIGIKILLTVH
jgi:putative Mn2+ efflux pump MntP